MRKVDKQEGAGSEWGSCRDLVWNFSSFLEFQLGFGLVLSSSSIIKISRLYCTQWLRKGI